MRRLILGLLVIGPLLTPTASAGDSNSDAIQKDRKQIEGTWRIVSLEVNGSKATEDDAQKLSVVNGSDGTWTLLSEGNEISNELSTIDATKNPKTLDFSPTVGEGKGDQYLGIYELGGQTRKMCFVPPGKERPTELTSTLGSERILVTFEREIDQVVKKDRKLIEGTWRVAALEIDGNRAMDEDVKKLKVVFEADGSWSLKSEVIEVRRGICTKFYVAPSGIGWPGGFSSISGSQHILLTLEREKTK